MYSYDEGPMYEKDQYEEDCQIFIWEESEKFSLKHDDEIIDLAIKAGKELDDSFEHFPAYSIALKLKKNGWKPTEKQRDALINVLAVYTVNQNRGEL